MSRLQPVMAWGDDKPEVKIAVACHCGEVFPLHKLEEAQRHVHGHLGEGDEPS